MGPIPPSEPPTLIADATPPDVLPAEVVQGAQPGGTVSSPKFTAPLLDVPQTIDVIPPDVFQAQGAETLTDVLRNTPGITLFAGEGGSADRTGGDSFYLRGFDTSNSIFVDGVRDEGPEVHDTFDIGQVDVVKGPSAENGRGGTAGYINLETKLPEAQAFDNLQFTHGLATDGSRAIDRVTLDANEPLADSPIPGTAFRLNLMDQQGGVPGRNYAENNRWGAAPSLALGLGRATRILLSYEHQYEHNLPDYGLPSTAVPGFAHPAAPATPSAFSPGVPSDTYFGFVPFDFEHVTADAAALRIERDLAPGLMLENQTRVAGTSRFVEASAASGSAAVAPPGQAGIQQGIYDTDNTILSNQTDLIDQFSTGPLAHTLTAGLELSRESADNPTWSLVPTGDPNPAYLVSLYDPLDFPAALPNYDPHETGAATDTRLDTEALYAFDTAKWHRHWELSAGLRLEHYAIDELSVTPASPAIAAAAATPGSANVPATAAAAATAAVPASSLDLATGRADVSGKVGLVCHPTDDASVYVSYDAVERPPGASTATNTLSSTATSADNPLLQPEKAVNYEIGAKWTLLDDQLFASLALFRSVVGNVPAIDPVTGLVNQASDQTIQGAELGLSGKIGKRWTVFAGYSQMDAQVSSEISANAQGLTLPLLPKESGNLWATCSLPRGFTLGGGAQYMGGTSRLQATGAPAPATSLNTVPSYWIVSAMASYVVNRHLTLRLNLFNALDREYIASLNNNGYRLTLGAPRNFLLTAEFKFQARRRPSP